MKILITGGNSFIGNKLTEKFISKGHKVIQVLRRPSRCPIGVQQILMPMEEYRHLGEKVGPCDCLVTLAWNGTRGIERMNSTLQQKNVEYSMDSVRSMLEVGCKRIVTAGSQAEYGAVTGTILETTSCHPSTEYGKAKLAFYEGVAELCTASGIPYKEPRFFSLYGPGDWEGSLVMSTLKKMLNNQVCLFTKCIQNWDYLYIDDAVQALSELCECDCSDGIYNFGSGEARSLKSYVLEMARITKTKSDMQFGAISYPTSGMVSLLPDVTKLKRELGWQPYTCFADGIRTIIRVMKQGK